MKLLNTAYAVLSDPDRRRSHDRWIAEEEKAERAKESSYAYTSSPPSPSPPPTRQRRGAAFSINEAAMGGRPSETELQGRKFGRHFRGNWGWYVLGGLVLIGLANNEPKSPPQHSQPYSALPVTAAPTANSPKAKWVRPDKAPSGYSWPVGADYVSGFRQLNTDGHSSVTIDNSRNNSDVYLKLVSLDTKEAFPVRHVFIPAFGSFTMNTVRAGNYDIRYRDLQTGGLSRSEALSVTESSSAYGIEYSNLTVTLYKVHNGNMQTYGLAESQF